ncbi:acyltransferase [Halobacillus amylolyticus]|uniref:Acyltransferase n=1 Tax=Halobacillus amylolyticus TaxID=2932259 RepID=A0ABY4HAM8_9BACI|nr:acyltransferase [Halobacillus amylolyticus]UOR11644.1 acyltransferase [Halobacillus amylolyticus]
MNRNTTIDFIKFFAMIFIVYIHANAFENVNILGVEGKKIDLIIDTFARFGVPFFFMVSGYLVVNQVQNRGGKYFTGYIFKLVKLYVAWFLFFIFYDLLMKIINEGFKTGVLWDYVASYNSLEVFYYGAGHTQYHLWYLLAAIWGMVIFSIFYYFQKTNILFFISLTLYLIGLLDQSYSGIYNLYFNSRDGIFFGLFYITLGAMFAQSKNTIGFSYRIKPAVWLVTFFGLSFIQVVERVVTIYWMNGKEGNYFISTIPIVIVLFLFIINKPDIGKGSWVNYIGKQTVGIYVVHTAVINITNQLIDYWELNYFREHLLWGILFTPYIFFFSYATYMTIQKLKKEALLRLKKNA